MYTQHITALLNNTASLVYDVYERRPGKYQLIVPILHEDGDMLDIYLQDSPLSDDYVRVCDYGLTLMRLSYTFDLTTDSQQRIFDSILVNNKPRPTKRAPRWRCILTAILPQDRREYGSVFRAGYRPDGGLPMG